MAPTSTPPKASAPTAGQPFKIFCDEHTPRRSGSSAFNADFPDSNNENNPNAAISKPASKSTGPPRICTTHRTRTFHRPEIAKLEDALEASKTQNQKMKGKIVAYQDALHQAYEDGYVLKE
ncbi:hypothetical protein E8E11_002401 [Didymella keratinophila]|nr:hypothetical protein E8E11_002401 [Didymella keratinophila]